LCEGGFCSAAGTICGGPPVTPRSFGEGGDWTGIVFWDPGAFAATSLGGPGMHTLWVAVDSQCSLDRQSPSQGARSHRPVRGLQVVPLVQVA
jgi:hypothetical protein